MRNQREYEISKALSEYLSYQYPNVVFHFDYAGLNLSKAQAGQMKAIQGGRGWPDLFIAEPRGGYHGLFIELKKEGEKIYKRDGTPKTEHLKEQLEMVEKLRARGYIAAIISGFDDCKEYIDDYMKFRPSHINR